MQLVQWVYRNQFWLLCTIGPLAIISGLIQFVALTSNLITLTYLQSALLNATANLGLFFGIIALSQKKLKDT